MAAGMTVEQAIQRSATEFKEVVWPAMGPRLGGGELIPVESVTDSPVANALDMLAGVDLWYVYRGQIFPIASRVQYGGRAWNTFTIRYSRPSGVATEYHKRLESIKNGSLYPRLTIQAYVHNGRLLSAAAVDTQHLMQQAERYRHQVRHNPADGATFVYVNWDQCADDYIITTGG